MTKVDFLNEFKAFTIAQTKDLIMPVAMQKGDTEQKYRAADVHLLTLPDSTAAKKIAPYILHQVWPGKDTQPEGKEISSSVQIRSIFVVYNQDKQEGGLMLLNLMERMRIGLLQTVVIGGKYELDLKIGLESIPYPEEEKTELKPYYAGEMWSTWNLPAIKREVSFV